MKHLFHHSFLWALSLTLVAQCLPTKNCSGQNIPGLRAMKTTAVPGQLPSRKGVIPTPEELLAEFVIQRPPAQQSARELRGVEIRLDSLIQYNLDSNQNRVPFLKSEFTVNADGQWVEEVRYNLSNGAWEPYARTTWTYDQEGLLVLTLNENYDIVEGWEPSQRTIMSYNQDGQMTKVTDESYVNGTWIGGFSGRRTFFYSDGLMTEHIFEGWDMQQGWTNQYRVTYTYNNDGLQTESLDYDYDAGTWSVTSKSTTTYDASGNRIKTETFYMDNGWEPIQRFEYTLDGQGLDTLVIAHFYYNGTWDLDKRTRNEFNASGALTSSRYDTWNINTSEWEPFYHTTYTFDQSNRQTASTVSSNWSGSYWNSVYEYVRTYEAADEADTVLYPAERGMLGESTYRYYSAFSGNPLKLMREDTMYYSTPEGWIAGNVEPLIDSEFAIYPNPANDKLHVQHRNGDDIHAIDLLDTKGNLVKRIRPNENGPIDVADCPPGVYFMKVSHDSGKCSMVKWIKN